MLTTQWGAWPMEGACWNEEERAGGKEDYEGPVVKGLLLEPEKVCRKSGTHSGN